MPVCARVINALRPPADEAIATISKVDASGESRLATCPLTISGYVRSFVKPPERECTPIRK